MTDLNLFLNKDLTADDVTHSNGMGAIAGGGGVGGLSIEKRRQLLNKPRVIGAYESSRLAHQGSSLKARTATQPNARIYDASNDSFSDEKASTNRQQAGIKDRTEIDQSINRRQQFTEPRGRNYDKYA